MPFGNLLLPSTRACEFGLEVNNVASEVTSHPLHDTEASCLSGLLPRFSRGASLRVSGRAGANSTAAGDAQSQRDPSADEEIAFDVPKMRGKASTAASKLTDVADSLMIVLTEQLKEVIN
jgi:hypothetical protein